MIHSDFLRGKKTDHLSGRVVAAHSAAGQVDVGGVDACRIQKLSTSGQVVGDADRQSTVTAATG